MFFLKNTIYFRRIAILFSLIIVSLILWNTYMFFLKFKEEERNKMELFASAMEEFSKNDDLNADFSIEGKIIESINNIPLILTDEDGNIIEFHNLNDNKPTSKDYLERQLAIMKEQNKPIEISYKKEIPKRYVYYRNSDLLNKLTYYPIALLLILALFLTVIYFFLNSNKIAEQNKLWTGMAKETAHQIGTPLSSLLGWITILKTQDVEPTYINEIEKDVNRLNTIANRFSKIGSLPELSSQNIVTISKTAFNYLRSRSSKKIKFNFYASQNEINVKINAVLYGWVIENLIKNAVDATQGKGIVNMHIATADNKVKIRLTDTGKGISKKQKKQIFNPGFTTKKRGWGLGLSLSKRIIESYHNGKIFVKNSEIGKGTTFKIILDRI